MNQNQLYKMEDLKKILPVGDRAAVHILGGGRILVFVAGKIGNQKLEAENSHYIGTIAMGRNERSLITQAADLLGAVANGQATLGHGDGTSHQFL